MCGLLNRKSEPNIEIGSHYVISEVDMGQPILVEEIPFIKGVDEDIKKLEQRIHENEWKAIVLGEHTPHVHHLRFKTLNNLH